MPAEQRAASRTIVGGSEGGFKIEIFQPILPTRFRFKLSGASVAFANSLRRAMIAEVPTMTIEYVEIEENSSALFDEFIAHRLGLIPLDSRSADEFTHYKECLCFEGKCNFCTVEFELNATCTTDEKLKVTSHHLKLKDNSFLNRDAMYKPLPMPQYDPNYDEKWNEENGIYIVDLKKNQSLKLRCEAKKGIGRVHAKFQPTCTAVFSYEADIKIDPDIERTLTSEQRQEMCNSCPKRLFEITTDIEDTLTTVQDAEILCVYCDECTLRGADIKEKEKARGNDWNKGELVTITRRMDSFIFDVETSGSIPPEQVVQRALKILEQKFAKLKADIESLDNNPISSDDANLPEG
jgi:DNA-directed RNA polymerase II subunit RPB3